MKSARQISALIGQTDQFSIAGKSDAGTNYREKFEIVPEYRRLNICL